MEWVLVLFAYAGIMASTDSMAMTTVPGFKSEATCEAAGELAKTLDDGTTKNMLYVCVEVK